MTLCRRGMMWVWMWSPSSTMIQRLPILWATAPVVPLPANESNTKSPLLVAKVKIRSIKRSGFGVSKNSLSIKDLISLLASLVVPTSLANQIVSGTLPSWSAKYIFRIILVSSSENLILPSFNSFSKVSRLNLQPLGGCSIVFPLGVVMLYIRFGLTKEFLTSPDLQSPLGSLSGFE